MLEASAGAWDRVLVLGDLVGYGAAPNEVIDRVQALNPVAIDPRQSRQGGVRHRGRQQLQPGGARRRALDARDADAREPPVPARTARRARGHRPGRRDLSRLAVRRGPLHLRRRRRAAGPGREHPAGLPVRRTRTCRSSSTTRTRRSTATFPPGDAPSTVDLQPSARHLINVGSVGQPRDGDPRAGYGIYDDEGKSVVLYRVEYAVDAAQRRILTAGLPASLANRLGRSRRSLRPPSVASATRRRLEAAAVVDDWLVSDFLRVLRGASVPWRRHRPPRASRAPSR